MDSLWNDKPVIVGQTKGSRQGGGADIDCPTALPVITPFAARTGKLTPPPPLWYNKQAAGPLHRGGPDHREREGGEIGQRP